MHDKVYTSFTQVYSGYPKKKDWVFAKYQWPVGRAGDKLWGFEVTLIQYEYKMISFRTPFCFANISAPFYRTEMVLFAKCVYGSSGEKKYLKIRYLVAEILSKMHIGTPCMHFLTFGGAKMQQFSWKTDNSIFKYHNFPILYSIFSTMDNYQSLIRGYVLAMKTVANLMYFWSNFGPLTAPML